MCTGMNTAMTKAWRDTGQVGGMNPVALARMIRDTRLQANTPAPPPATNSPERASIPSTGLTIPTNGNTRSR